MRCLPPPSHLFGRQVGAPCRPPPTLPADMLETPHGCQSTGWMSQPHCSKLHLCGAAGKLPGQVPMLELRPTSCSVTPAAADQAPRASEGLLGAHRAGQCTPPGRQGTACLTPRTSRPGSRHSQAPHAGDAVPLWWARCAPVRRLPWVSQNLDRTGRTWLSAHLPNGWAAPVGGNPPSAVFVPESPSISSCPGLCPGLHPGLSCPVWATLSPKLQKNICNMPPPSAPPPSRVGPTSLLGVGGAPMGLALAVHTERTLH